MIQRTARVPVLYHIAIVMAALWNREVIIFFCLVVYYRQHCAKRNPAGI